ncbi:MAG: DNA gyrase inhibitor YacG [Phycisphaerae bacterium]|nr:DNA gyrase inhibitor YacG [Phycisphaerae bacterium]
MAMDFKCPICGKAIPSATSDSNGSKRMNARFFPFCSERCRLVDLGTWLEGDYRIPTTQRPEDMSSDDE